MIFRRYLLVSALSLAADWLCLTALISLADITPGVAAVAGYLVGGMLNYSLSRCLVFRSAVTGRRRLREIILFGVSCVLGALLTGTVVHVVTPALGQFVAKASAVAVSLVTLYWLRRMVVFGSRGLIRGSIGS